MNNRAGSKNAVPRLEPGDRLSRAEFERRYEAMPDGTNAERIEGVVYIHPPVSLRHGAGTRYLSGWMGLYEAATPGVRGADHPTVRLDLDNEPQPDGLLLIDPAHGGQARISADDYIENAPELLAEVSASSVSIDLHAKLRVYERNRVREYIVWRVLDRAVDWFTLRDERFSRLLPGDDGVIRSDVFPRLWLDTEALLRGDLARELAVVQQGTATVEHAAFIAQLQTFRPGTGDG